LVLDFPGHRQCCAGNTMQVTLDLDLWLDQSLIQRQNQLKADFLDLFEQLGNSITNEELTSFFSNSKGKKISKGNQLQGFPYFVLDLVRNFELEGGCNIRFVSWFGHGLYCCVFLGKELTYPTKPFYKAGFKLGNTHSPWDLPAQVEYLRKTESIPSEDPGAKLWVKEISIPSNKDLVLKLLKEELNNILQVKPI